MPPPVSPVSRRAAWGAAATGVLAALAAIAGFARFGIAPAAPAAPVPGATLARVRDVAGTGFVVTSLRTGGSAAAAGLRVGDVIDGVPGRLPAGHGPIDLKLHRDHRLVKVHMERTSAGETSGQAHIGDRGRPDHR